MSLLFFSSCDYLSVILLSTITAVASRSIGISLSGYWAHCAFNMVLHGQAGTHNWTMQMMMVMLANMRMKLDLYLEILHVDIEGNIQRPLLIQVYFPMFFHVSCLKPLHQFPVLDVCLLWSLCTDTVLNTPLL